MSLIVSNPCCYTISEVVNIDFIAGSEWNIVPKHSWSGFTEINEIQNLINL